MLPPQAPTTPASSTALPDHPPPPLSPPPASSSQQHTNKENILLSNETVGSCVKTTGDHVAMTQEGGGGGEVMRVLGQSEEDEEEEHHSPCPSSPPPSSTTYYQQASSDGYEGKGEVEGHEPSPGSSEDGMSTILDLLTGSDEERRGRQASLDSNYSLQSTTFISSGSEQDDVDDYDGDGDDHHHHLHQAFHRYSQHHHLEASRPNTATTTNRSSSMRSRSNRSSSSGGLIHVNRSLGWPSQSSQQAFYLETAAAAAAAAAAYAAREGMGFYSSPRPSKARGGPFRKSSPRDKSRLNLLSRSRSRLPRYHWPGDATPPPRPNASPVDLSNTRNVDGHSALHLAALQAFVPGIDILIANGADVNVRDSRGRIPLHTVCEIDEEGEGEQTDSTSKALPALIKLLEAGGDPDAEDEDGNTPLHLCAYYNRPDCLLELLRYGAQPNTCNAHGDTPLHVATGAGHVRCMELLMAWVSGKITSTCTTTTGPQQEKGEDEVEDEGHEVAESRDYEQQQHLPPAENEEEVPQLKVYPYGYAGLPEGSEWERQEVEQHEQAWGRGYEDQALAQDTQDHEALDYNYDYDQPMATADPYAFAGMADYQPYSPEEQQVPSMYSNCIVQDYGDWLVCLTADRRQYYYVNTLTGATQWACPWASDTAEDPWVEDHYPVYEEGREPMRAQEERWEQDHKAQEHQEATDVTVTGQAAPVWEDGDIFEDVLQEEEESDPIVAPSSLRHADAAPSPEKMQKHMAIFERFLSNALKAADTSQAAILPQRQQPRRVVGWPEPLADTELDEIMQVCRQASDRELHRQTAVEMVVASRLADMEELLMLGVSPATSDGELKRSLLHHACKRGDASMVALLSREGADIEAKDAQGNTPLHLAAEWGHLEALTCLLESAADVKSVNVDGDTPMHLSAIGGHLACTKKLLLYGAETHAINKHGFNPYYNALKRGHRRRHTNTERLMQTLQFLAKKRGCRDALQERRILDIKGDSRQEEEKATASSSSLSFGDGKDNDMRRNGIIDAYEEVMGLETANMDQMVDDDEEEEEEEGADRDIASSDSSLLWSIASYVTRNVVGKIVGAAKKTGAPEPPEKQKDRGLENKARAEKLSQPLLEAPAMDTLSSAMDPSISKLLQQKFEVTAPPPEIEEDLKRRLPYALSNTERLNPPAEVVAALEEARRKKADL